MHRFRLFLAFGFAGAAFSASADPMIPNGGFERWDEVKNPQTNIAKFPDNLKPEGWSPGNHRPNQSIPQTSEAAKDTTVKHGGEASIRLTCTAPTSMPNQAATWDIKVTPEKYYRLSAWVKGENIQPDPKARTAGAIMTFSTAPAKNFWQRQYMEISVFQPSGTFEWKQVSKIYNVMRNCDRLLVAFALQNASGTLWVDDVTLEESSEEEFLKQEESEITAKQKPSVFHLHYGPSGRQIMNLYLAKSETPTPVFVIYHGGGWLGGNGVKEAEQGRNDGAIERMNRNGISVAVVNYRLSPLPAPLHDAARAIQFLRYNAAKYNLNKERFLAHGFSAGATTSLWLAAHDDMADPKSDDPIARESTRLCGAWVLGAQATIDPVQIRAWNNEDALKHAMFHRAFDFANNKEMEEKYEQFKDQYREYSPVTHVSKDDPPVLLGYSRAMDDPGDGVHHTKFGYGYKLAADKVGAPCDLLMNPKDKDMVSVPRYTDGTKFVIETLTGKPQK